MCGASSDRAKATSAATSSGSTISPIGTWLAGRRRYSPQLTLDRRRPRHARHNRVHPDLMWGASSTASARII